MIIENPINLAGGEKKMKKVVFVLALVLFSGSAFAGSFCEELIFTDNSAYIEDQTTVASLKAICESYPVSYKSVCDRIEFKDDGYVWVVDGEVENIKLLCNEIENEKKAQAKTASESDKGFFYWLFYYYSRGGNGLVIHGR